jgi:hypothetical protein
MVPCIEQAFQARDARTCGEKAEVAGDSSLVKLQRDDDMPVANRERKIR